jgi:hypothetical protein
LRLSDSEINDLVEFIRALTGDVVLRQCQTAVPQKAPKDLGFQLANIWPKRTAHDVYAMVRNGKEPENLNFSSVAATFEKAITYVFAERLIRNAEARGSIPLCSTINSHHTSNLPSHTQLGPTSQLANTWPKIMTHNMKEQYAMGTHVKATQRSAAL